MEFDLFRYSRVQYCTGMIEAYKAQIIAMQIEDSFQPIPELKHTAKDYRELASLIAAFANDIATISQG